MVMCMIWMVVSIQKKKKANVHDLSLVERETYKYFDAKHWPKQLLEFCLSIIHTHTKEKKKERKKRKEKKGVMVVV